MSSPTTPIIPRQINFDTTPEPSLRIDGRVLNITQPILNNDALHSGITGRSRTRTARLDESLRSEGKFSPAEEKMTIAELIAAVDIGSTPSSSAVTPSTPDRTAVRPVARPERREEKKESKATSRRVPKPAEFTVYVDGSQPATPKQSPMTPLSEGSIEKRIAALRLMR